jgi:hypothetical protein
MAEFPSMAPTNVMRTNTERWKALPAEEKEKWNSKYRVQRDAFALKRKEYQRALDEEA